MSEARTDASRAGVDELLPPGQLASFGLQHLLAMYAGMVAVPLIIGATLGLSQDEIVYLIGIDFLLSGCGCLLQALGPWKIGVRLPLVIGASFTGLAASLSVAGEYGLPVLFGAILLSGVFVILMAPVVGRLLRFFPPIVMGTVILLLGLLLVPAAVGMIAGPDPEAADYASTENLVLGGLTLLTLLLGYRFFKGLLQQSAMLVAIAVGTVVAIAAGIAEFGSVGDGKVLALPDPVHFGAPEFEPAAIITMLIISCVVMVEGIGQTMSVGESVGKPIGRVEITRSLRAEGVVNVVSGGVFQSLWYNNFSNCAGVVELTRVRSRYVVAATGLMLGAMAFLPIIGRVIASVPRPIFGGAALAMFALVAVVGLRILSSADLTKTSNLVVVAASLGVGLIPSAAPDFYRSLPDDVQLVLGSGLVTGAALAVGLNLLFNHLSWGREPAVRAGLTPALPEPAPVISVKAER